MESFALLRFWKSNTSAKVAAGTTPIDGDAISDYGRPTVENDDDDDSFFELELTLPSYESKFNKPNLSPKKPEQEKEIKPKLISKPQAPISILRSASPKLRVFMFGKFKRRAKREEMEMETKSVSSFSPKRNSSKLYTVKFKIEDGSIVPELTRNNSSTLSSPNLRRRSFDECCESSKRFSIEVVRRYLNLIKPLYVKSLKRNSGRENSMTSPMRSTASLRKRSEEKQYSRFKVKCRHLGKSKSTSSVMEAPAPVRLSLGNNDSCDGIEGAILHCKRSLSSSKGNLSLSRCSSDPSHEKLLIMSEEISTKRN